MSRVCAGCCWLSTGFGDDVRGAGWCYSSEKYVEYEDYCDQWASSLRAEPVNKPEAALVDAVARLDRAMVD